MPLINRAKDKNKKYSNKMDGSKTYEKLKNINSQES